MPLATINPATGETLQIFPELSTREIDAKLDLAQSAFHVHRHISFVDRSAKLSRAGELFEADQEQLARLAALEMGKPLAQGRAEAVKCAAACRWFAEHAERLLANERIDENSFIRYEPLGVVLALMPWNFPFWQVVRFAAPALMAGNVGVVKHADNTPQCGAALGGIFDRAGFAAGCLQYLAVPVPGVQALIEDPRVDAVTLTGSVEAGRAVASVAGAKLKPTVLELGGSDPFIVMPSTNLDHTIKTAVQARTQNAGQSCIAAKRFIVHEAIFDGFAAGLVQVFRALRVGDPFAVETEVGPLARASGLENLQRQVLEAVKAGATILAGGSRIPGPGYYFEPTVLADLPADAPIGREEFFGPVALLHRVRNLDHALALANDSPFGLGASFWSTVPAEQDRAIAELQAGQVFINAMVASSPELPFGGVKDSGYGRELGGLGIRSFVNAKSVRRGNVCPG